MPEVKAKLARVRNYLKQHRLEAAVFATRANFAWLTCGGDNHVVSQTEGGAAALVVTPRRAILVVDRIEAERMVAEEHLGDWTLAVHPWSQPLSQAIRRAVGRKPAAGDDPVLTGLPPLPGDFNDEVRASLADVDLKHYRALGRDCALAIETVARQLEPGCSGHQVEADLARHLLARGIQPHVVLVGFDDRLHRYRHPVPTANHLRHHAMLVICGRRYGLIANLTRCVHFGPPPAELRRQHLACCRVEAAYWRATVPGATWGAAFKAGMRQYQAEGYPREWENHHQGGPTGFAGRDFLATAVETRQVQLHQAVAWNPSLPGVKSEDTFVVTEDGPDVLTTATGDWPLVKVDLDGYVLRRPDILVR